jgi:hypothetical protein
MPSNRSSVRNKQNKGKESGKNGSQATIPEGETQDDDDTQENEFGSEPEEEENEDEDKDNVDED